MIDPDPDDRDFTEEEIEARRRAIDSLTSGGVIMSMGPTKRMDEQLNSTE
ncbi:MAG: hypothetical protein U5K37_08725 [Natrialbaceae archaeon]|nr:hypothetical protein [Natrialbaceae archaeon]